MFGKLKRLATHAGTWYPSDKKTLDSQLDTYLLKAKQEIAQDKKSDKGKIRAIIGPHAGLDYSGQVAAYAYCQINPNDYKRIILLGPSHHIYLDSCALTMCSIYKTPLGDLNIDSDLNQKLGKENKFRLMPIEIDEKEHSLEMHLPFIKKVFSNRKDIKLVPILVGNLTQQKEKYYGKMLAEYLKEDDQQDNLFIVSSDFCHWGQRFDYIFIREPSNIEQSVSQQIEKLDKQGIDKILNHDPEGFNAYLEETDNTICGRHAIGVLLECLKQSSNMNLKTELVKYAQSEPIIDPVRDSSVSYASIITRQI